MNKPKVLIFDIETAPLIAHLWSMWQDGVGLNQIETDWSVLSWSAKWLNDSKVMYQDVRREREYTNDKRLLKGIWKLLDQADVVITQNGKKFDVRKLNARFILSGFQPPSSFKHIDTREIAKRKFAFTSSKLEYMTEKLNKKYRKQKHKKYPGHEMWVECMAGNTDAWNEMQKYNKYDVLALEELYKAIIPWDDRVNFNLYHDELENVCKCGGTEFQKNGYTYTAKGRFQRYKCKACGSESKDTKNLFSKEKRASLRTHITG